MTKKFKITIIGDGKLATALVTGFILSGELPQDILVIGRTLKKAQDFNNLGVVHTVQVSYQFDTEFLFLVVVPSGIGSIISNLKSSLEQKKVNFTELISFVSGLSQYILDTYLESNVLQIAVATSNTNVASNVGVVCVQENSYSKNTLQLLKKLGVVVTEKDYQHLVIAIMTVGSMNAFDAQAIKLTYESYLHQDTGITLYDYLRGLLMCLTRNTSVPVLYGEYILYTNCKTKFFETLYTFEDACASSFGTSESTIRALLAVGPTVSVSSIDALIKTVVTKGGCTEKGINEINSISVITHTDQLTPIFRKVYDSAMEFPAIARKSFNES